MYKICDEVVVQRNDCVLTPGDYFNRISDLFYNMTKEKCFRWSYAAAVGAPSCRKGRSFRGDFANVSNDMETGRWLSS